MRIRSSLSLAVFLLLTANSFQNNFIPGSERTALLALYESTQGEKWHRSDNWMGPPGTEDSWYGVTVEDGHVTSLILNSNEVNGTIPPDLGRLAELRTLSLYGRQYSPVPGWPPYYENELVGTIPSEIGSLVHLEHLNLAENRLQGPIPSEFGNLESLHTLDLHRNQISEVPAVIGNLSQLQVLDLGGNSFASLPESIGSLSALLSLRLAGSRLRELPDQIGNLTSLEELKVNSSRLVELPEELGQLVNLQNLNVRDNRLLELPPSLSNLSSLKTLSIDETNISSLPPEFENLTQLEKLTYVRGDHDSLPSGIENLKSLRSLILWGNRLTDLPAELVSLQQLEELDISHNRFQRLPAVVSEFPLLTDLRISGNPLAGEIPLFVFQLPLDVLDLSGFAFTGSIPPEIADMIQLRVLNLASNELSGDIPPELGKLINLTELRLAYNDLTGPLPAEFGDLVNLEVLDLRGNEMRGPIPPEIGRLKNLRELRWSSNRLDGEIPSEVGDLVSLERLYLDHNRLSGEIPGTLSQVPKLHLDHNQLSGRVPPGLGGLDFVQLSYNHLTGPIPPELSLSRRVLLCGNFLTGDISANFPENFCSSTSTIEQLDASDNDLSGNVPAHLLSCLKLESLDLSHNRLQGAIPSGLSDSGLERLYLAGNLLTGPVPPDLMNLGGGSRARIDLSWNGLSTEIEDLLAFLGVEFEATQTIAPFDAEIDRVTGTSAVAQWDAIPFVGKVGGYEVLVATQSGGPYRLYDRTFNKEVESLQVIGLDTDTQYYFRVRTVTEPHSLNRNRIVSEPGPEILVRTASRGRSILPLFSGVQTATGMAVASDSDNAATLDFEALDVFGNLLNAGTNPAQRQLLPGEQFALLDTDLFGQSHTQELAGWIDLGSDDSRFGSLFQILGPNQVDGAVPATVSSRTLYFSRIHEGPESFREQPASTLVSLVNPHQEECQIALRYHPHPESGPASTAGLTETLRIIPPRGMIISTIRDLLVYCPGSSRC